MSTKTKSNGQSDLKEKIEASMRNRSKKEPISLADAHKKFEKEGHMFFIPGPNYRQIMLALDGMVKGLGLQGGRPAMDAAEDLEKQFKLMIKDYGLRD